MKKRVMTYLFIGILILLILSPAAFAAKRSILQPLDDLFLGLLHNNDDFGIDVVKQNPTIWIFATFTVVFSIFYAGTALVPVFKEQNGARVAFSIAFGVLSIAIPGVIGIMAGLGFVGMMVLVIVGLFFIIFTAIRDFSTGYKEAATRGLGAAKDFKETEKDLKKVEQDFKKQENDFKKEERLERDQKSLVSKLKGVQRDIGTHLGREKEYLKDMLNKLRDYRNLINKGPETPEAQRLKEEMKKDFTSLVPDINLLETKFEPLRKQIEDNLSKINYEEFAITKAAWANDAKMREELAAGAIKLKSGATWATAPNVAKVKLEAVSKRIDFKDGSRSTKTVMEHLIYAHTKRIKMINDLQGKEKEFKTHQIELNNHLTKVRGLLGSGDFASVNVESSTLSAIDTITKMEQINKYLIDADVKKIVDESIVIVDAIKKLITTSKKPTWK